VLHH